MEKENALLHHLKILMTDSVIAVKMVVRYAQLIQIVQNVSRVISLKKLMGSIIVFNVKTHVQNVLLQKTVQHVILQASNGTTLKKPVQDVLKVVSGLQQIVHV